jgi:hypothetical protein
MLKGSSMTHQNSCLDVAEGQIQTSDTARDTNTPTETLKLFSRCTRLLPVVDVVFN